MLGELRGGHHPGGGFLDLTRDRLSDPVGVDGQPATANPHLHVNQSTAGRTGPVSRGYIQYAVRQLGVTAQNLQADRLHDEAEASAGDPIQLIRLFGISDPTAIRYCAELDQTISASPGARRDTVNPP